MEQDQEDISLDEEELLGYDAVIDILEYICLDGHITLAEWLDELNKERD